MKFEFVEYHRKATDEELKNDLKRVAVELNKQIITQKEYNENGKFHCDTVSDRFGSWNNALNLVGLQGGNRFFQEELYNNLDYWFSAEWHVKTLAWMKENTKN